MSGGGSGCGDDTLAHGTVLLYLEPGVDTFLVEFVSREREWEGRVTMALHGMWLIECQSAREFELPRVTKFKSICTHTHMLMAGHGSRKSSPICMHVQPCHR